VLAAFVFVRIGFVYPSKTPVLRRTTLVLAVVWGASLVWLILQYPDVPGGWLAATLAFPVYYTTLSFVLEAQRRGR
jgi:phosphatidylcholine synthase